MRGQSEASSLWLPVSQSLAGSCRAAGLPWPHLLWPKRRSKELGPLSPSWGGGTDSPFCHLGLLQLLPRGAFSEEKV